MQSQRDYINTESRAGRLMGMSSPPAYGGLTNNTGVVHDLIVANPYITKGTILQRHKITKAGLNGILRKLQDLGFISYMGGIGDEAKYKAPIYGLDAIINSSHWRGNIIEKKINEARAEIKKRYSPA